MNIEEKIYDFIGKSLLIIIGIIATVGAFVNMFRINANMLVIIFFTIIITLFFMLISLLKHKNLIMIGIGALVLILIFLLHNTLEVGIFEIANKIIEAYNNYFGVIAGEKFNVDYEKHHIFHSNGPYITLFICILIIEYSYILVTATWYKCFSGIHMLISMAIVLVGLLLGVFPNTIYVALLVYYYMMCVMFGKNKRIYLGRMGGVAAAICIILLFILLLNFPSNYNSEDKYEKYRVKVEKVIENLKIDDLSFHSLKNLFSKNESTSGGVNGGKLGDVERIEYSGQTMLKVQMNKCNNNVYLKGYVANEYERNKWSKISQPHIAEYREYENNHILGSNALYINNYILNDYFQDVKINYMKIDYKNATKEFVYFPYYSNLEEESSYYGLTLTRNDKDQLEYVYKDIRVDELIDINDISSNMEAINMFKDISMTVPSDISDFFAITLDNPPVYDGSSESIRQCIDYVQKYLWENTKYSLTPGKLENGNDYVLDFLREKKKGYCTAYASAAVLMFRYMGIPSRYVEGYVISTDEQNKEKEDEEGYISVDVTDSSAHAWAEIYINNLGFVPIEVTPGYFDSDDDSSNPDSEVSTTPMSSETESTSKEEQITTTKPEDTSEEETTTIENGVIKTNKNKDSRNDKNIFGIFGVLLVVIVIIIISIKIYKIKFNENKQNILNYSTDDIRHNIIVLTCIIKMELEKINVVITKDKRKTDIEELINEKIDKMNKIAAEENNIDKSINIPDKKMTSTILDIMYAAKYSNENVQFSNEECAKVRQYVEEFKNSLQYFKNRL